MNFRQFIRSQVTDMHWLTALVLWGVFVLVAFLLVPVTGTTIGALLIVPAAILSWFLGSWLGALLTFAGFSIYYLLLQIYGYGEITRLLGTGSTAGIIATIILSGVVGRIGAIARAQKKDLNVQKQAADHHLAQNLFLAMLNDIVQASLEVDNMDSMLKILVSRMGELFNADDCFITFWEEKRKLTIPKAAYGTNSEMYTSVVAKPGELTLTASVLEAGHALVVENPHNSPYVDPVVVAPFPKILSSLVLPLVSGSRKLGAIILSFHAPREYSNNDIEWAELAARHISLAMTKLVLLEDARRKADEFAGLFEISSVLYLQEDPSNIFSRLSESMARLMNVEICLISLYNPETDEFLPQASAFGIKDEQLGQLAVPKNLGEPTWDFATTEVFIANSFSELPVEFQDYALKVNASSVMVIPMWRSNRELFGMVYLANRPGGFDQEDALQFGMFSAQVSFVIQNHQLISSEHRRNEELSVLHAIASAAMTASDEDELIEFVTRMIGEKLYPDNFGILMLDEASNTLRLHSSYRLGLKQTVSNIPLGVGICGNVAQTGSPRRVPDITQAADYLAVDDRILSELCVPLLVEGKVIGVINSESALLNAFSQRDEELLGIIAAQLTTTMQRLRAIDAQRKQNIHLERSNAMIKVLAQVGSRASSAVNPEGVMQTLGKELTAMGLFCLIALPDPETQDLHVTYTSIPARLIQLLEHASHIKFDELKIPREELKLFSDGSLHPLLLKGPVEVVSSLIPGFPRENVERVLSAMHVTAQLPICHLPLVVDGELIGVFWLWGEDLQESDLPTMTIFASQVAIALQNAHLLARVQKMALTDDLTGIFNRGHFFELAEHEFSQSRRYELPLSVIILDVDHFKKFNDRYGHIVGDQVLRNVASVLQTNLREHDILGRYGGEEFAILMPVTDLKAAQVVALRLKNCVSESQVETDAGPVGVNISIGVSELNPDMPTLLSLIHRADQAMYIAKSTGGNGVATK